MGDRKQSDQKYRKSDKGKKTMKNWSYWERVKSSYKEDICISCQKKKTIVSKGRCNACRMREARINKKLSENT